MAPLVTCVLVWTVPEAIARLLGASEPQLVSETSHALRISALSIIPFCYIYVLMIVYKLYRPHGVLFISQPLSLTVIGNKYS